MAFWDGVERAGKIAGIVGGAAAAFGIWFQLYDLNAKESQKKVEEWQAAAVFKIINDNNPIKFDAISMQYVAAAAKFPSEIPRERLSDEQLQLAILRLLQSQILILTEDNKYAVRRDVNFSQSFASAMRMMDDTAADRMRIMSAARSVLLQISGPVSDEQFRQRLLPFGVNKELLQREFTSVIEQLQFENLIVWQDGMIRLIRR